MKYESIKKNYHAYYKFCIQSITYDFMAPKGIEAPYGIIKLGQVGHMGLN